MFIKSIQCLNAGVAISFNGQGEIVFDAWDSGTGWENVCYQDAIGNSVVTYTYEVVEVPVNGYLTGYLNNGVNTGTITITNKPKYESTNVEVQKVWLDAEGNELSDPPGEIKVKLQRAAAEIDGCKVRIIVTGSSAYQPAYEESVIVKRGTETKTYTRRKAAI